MPALLHHEVVVGLAVNSDIPGGRQRVDAGLPVPEPVFAEVVFFFARCDALFTTDATSCIDEDCGGVNHTGSFAFPRATPTCSPACGGKCQANSEMTWVPGRSTMWLSLVSGIRNRRRFPLAR